MAICELFLRSPLENWFQRGPVCVKLLLHIDERGLLGLRGRMDQVGEVPINLFLPLTDLPAILGSAAPIGIQQVIPNQETGNLASSPDLSQIPGAPMIRFIDLGDGLV